ncbi:inorganic phosphate transporter [Ornithobacterium rhinotracheale]|uniref:inorganic phosphate transporter n=1 Tax=Ornithobacterium rhinotracheale TaxID=28251 RepID=UPI0021595D22|nr:inorganic phosphate transporter [Ornithobacterium rhinotracheale]UVD86789.1 inorganic phosphate transporter [Ornithobacterium rhinotracheale]
MESYMYVFIVGLLFCLAIFDLVVGVSNDAVNFLNSAIGSKAAKWKTIMIIASVGIMLGAMTSGGMMEVARKGIFNPQHFYFNEIMILFLAVMVTDIILLDIFNTLALPTSTTVSIVFEILGASLALATIKVLHNELPMTYLFNNDNPAEGIVGFMNWSKAGEIITGILLSVVIAFTIGSIVQFISRFLFSFEYQKKMKFFGSIFTGIAFTALSYFLLFKGMKNIPAMEGIINEVGAHIKYYILGAFVFFSFMMFLIQKLNINPLKIVVLFGTFSLAMAFAGNDLVNFIGVPIAGWQSFQIWQNSGMSPESLEMVQLAGKVETPYILLVGAGIVMTLTLWLSKKARSVTETEVNLGAQSEIDERFKPNLFARGLVNATSAVNKGFIAIAPQSLLDKISEKFTPMEIIESNENAAHFDLVRASVNLLTAAILISAATSMQLPLSTTYVSFMVAMGTSLADRAWGRESAVYRVAGVMNVIGGWFMTAIIAAVMAMISASIMYFCGVYGIVALCLLVIFIIYKSSKHHAISLKRKARSESKASINYKDLNQTMHYLTESVSVALKDIKRTLELTNIGVAKENKKALQNANDILNELHEEYAMVKSGLFKIIKKNKSDETTSAHLYVLTYDLMQDILQSLDLIVTSATTHVNNNHKPLAPEQCQHLASIKERLAKYIAFLQEIISNRDFSQKNLDEIQIMKKHFLQEIEDATSEQINGVMNKQYGFKNTSLYFTILLEMKDLVAVAARFVKLYARIYKEGKLTK